MAQLRDVHQSVFVALLLPCLMTCANNLKTPERGESPSSFEPSDLAHAATQVDSRRNEAAASSSNDETQISGTSRIDTIELKGFSPTLVRVPAGSAKRPAIFVTHGAGGTAQEHLRYWSQLLDEYLIFSLAGTALSAADPEGGHYYKTHLELEREMLALIAHLKHPDHARFDYVSRLEQSPWVFAGYSQGATMGALFLLNYGQTFDRLILIEGGTEGWTFSRSEHFKKEGGRQVLWLCGTKGCRNGAQAASLVAKQSKLSALLVFVESAGHIYWGPVQKQLAKHLPSVLAPESVPIQ